MRSGRVIWVAARKPPFADWRLSALVLSTALATGAAGAALVWLRWQDPSAHAYAVSAAAAFFASSLVQLRVAYRSMRGQTPRLSETLCSRTFRRALFVGAVAAYVLALAHGPAPDLEYTLLGVVVLWYSILLLRFAADSQVLEQLRGWLGGRVLRRTGRIAYFCLFLAAAAEVCLRVSELLPRPESSANAGLSSLAPFNASKPPLLASPSRPTMATPGTFRVAAIGSERALGGATAGSYLSRLETTVPGLAVRRFFSSTPETARQAKSLVEEVRPYRPDLVLAFVVVGDDLCQESKSGGIFDWRELRVAQFCGFLSASRVDVENSAGPEPGDQQAFLRDCAPRLATCRTPIPSEMQHRWTSLLGRLDHLIVACRQEKLSLTLVVLPGPFQVNQALCNTLGRRMGYDRNTLDLDLPQRRLMAFADRRGVPILDLLPGLRRCDESTYQANSYQWNELGKATATATLGGWLKSRYGATIIETARLGSQH